MAPLASAVTAASIYGSVNLTQWEIESLMDHTFEPVLGPRIVFNDHDGNSIVLF